jgi:MOSC domain-containing protein YiiM
MAELLVGQHRPGFYMRVIGEGHIEAGDPIVKTRAGPGTLTVADTDALLYLPHRDRAKLQVALTIPALSPGWQGSFRDLLAAADGHGDGDGTAAQPDSEPAWSGFRALRVTKVVKETATVASLYLAAAEGKDHPGPHALLPHRQPDRLAGTGAVGNTRAHHGGRHRGAGDRRAATPGGPHRGQGQR